MPRHGDFWFPAVLLRPPVRGRLVRHSLTSRQKGGGPLIQCGVSLAMRMMGSQFVSGRRIEEALTNARWFEAQGLRYSYDMLGEASTTAADARRYYDDYFQAIHAIARG
jgi:RHH-type proline utilization regulon transcriptional repressor/proline dehydrogenase/delta 1-pyrroline-5-carboxylate dehydrogenase